MPAEPEQSPPPSAESDQKPLCLNCLSPNETSVHFCVTCGAPLTSYAATGPFESLFAEGHSYRQAVEKPRKLIVVVGVWLIFGMMALAGATSLFLGPPLGTAYMATGAFLLVISPVMIWRTTRSYVTRRKTDETHDS